MCCLCVQPGPVCIWERKVVLSWKAFDNICKRTDKLYLLLCIFSSTMAVVALASWAAKQGNGFATDELTGAVIGIGDYRRALVQAGAAVLASSLRCCSPASTTAALSRCGRCM